MYEERKRSNEVELLKCKKTLFNLIFHRLTTSIILSSYKICYWTLTTLTFFVHNKDIYIKSDSHFYLFFGCFGNTSLIVMWTVGSYIVGGAIIFIQTCSFYFTFELFNVIADWAVLHCIVLYCTVLYCTVFYCTVLFCD